MIATEFFDREGMPQKECVDFYTETTQPCGYFCLPILIAGLYAQHSQTYNTRLLVDLRGLCHRSYDEQDSESDGD